MVWNYTISTLCLAALLTATTAAAQDSRAAELAAQQADKSKKLAPNTASKAEKALEWFEGHITDPNTFYLTFGGLYPSGGFAPGLAARRAIGHARLNVRGGGSLRGEKTGQGAL